MRRQTLGVSASLLADLPFTGLTALPPSEMILRKYAGMAPFAVAFTALPLSVHIRGIHGCADAGKNPDRHGMGRGAVSMTQCWNVLGDYQIRGPGTQGQRTTEYPAARNPELC